MTASSRVWTMGLLLASVAAIGQAADTIKGTASLNGQAATFTQGLGVLSTKNHALVVGFFPAALSAADQAPVLKEGFLNVGGDAPYLVLKLSFPEGAKNASDPVMCELDYFNYKDGVHQFQNLASACSIAELGGDLGAGGVVHGKLKGTEKVDGKTHGWDLEFATTLRAGQ